MDLMEFSFFETFQKNDGVVFPLNYQPWTRFIIVSLLIVVFCIGLRYRILIYTFLRASNSKESSINTLMWIQQLAEVPIGSNVLFWIFVFSSSISLKEIANQKYCEWYRYFMCLPFAGPQTWNFIIAFYRVLCLKAQKFVKDIIGEKLLAFILIVIGITFNVMSSSLAAYYDDRSILQKLCQNLTYYDAEIYRNYQVLFVIFLVYFIR